MATENKKTTQKNHCFQKYLKQVELQQGAHSHK